MKFLITLVCVYFLVKWTVRWVLRLWLKDMAKKGGFTAYGRTYTYGGAPGNGPGAARRPEGSIRVEQPGANGRPLSDMAGGEYIDYEEVK